MWIALFVRMLETAYHTTGSLGGEWENCVGAGGKPLVASIVATDAELASTARVCGRRAVHKLRERLDQLSRAVARCSGPGIAGSARSSIGPSGPSGHASDGRSTGFWSIASSHVLLRRAPRIEPAPGPQRLVKRRLGQIQRDIAVPQPVRQEAVHPPDTPVVDASEI